MKWFIHNLEWKISTSDPEHLEKLKNKEYLLSSLWENWDPLVELDDFVWVLKTAPYSSEDMMFIYSWDNPNVTNLNQIEPNKLNLVFDALDFAFDRFSKEYMEEINQDKKQIVVWLNTWIIPHHNCIQSVSRPHFHFTILSKFQNLENNINTEVIDIINTDCDRAKKMFCIREKNYVHLNNIVWILNRYDKFVFNWKNYPILFKTSSLGTLDIYLPDLENTFWELNRNFIMNIYTIINNYQLSYKKWVEKWDIQNFWFSFWITKEDWRFIMKIKFFVKNNWDNWWSMELFNHSINRVRLDNPKLPNLDKFSKKVREIF